MKLQIPSFLSDNDTLNRAWRIAMGDLISNIEPYQAGLLKKPEPCLMAGLGYSTPWMRDTAINTMLALSWLSPEVAKNTLLSVCTVRDGKAMVNGWGQDWDALIWVLGAYQYLQVSNDEAFLPLMKEITANSLAYHEQEAYDMKMGLFRGPAVYGDGIAAYPDKYVCVGKPGIVDCPIPMYTLSTNCMYYMVYRVAQRLGITDAGAKAQRLRQEINCHFWDDERGTYDYIAHECSHQEGLGLAFALLCDVAEEDKVRRVVDTVQMTDQGIACVYPSFERYRKLGGQGRHSGTIWPFIQGFWGLSLHRHGQYEAFDRNLYQMAEKAVRDGQFAELYHGETGEIYGGLQEDAPDGHIRLWNSTPRQTWSATAFLAQMIYGVFGCQWKQGILSHNTRIPYGCSFVHLYGVSHKDGLLDIE